MAGVLVFELLLPPSPPEVVERPVRSGVSDAALTAAEQSEPESMEGFAVVRERPLFTEGRRPQEEEVPEVQPPAPQADVTPPPISLSGIVRVGDQVYAVLAQPGGKDGSKRLKQGELYNGWVVQRIDDLGIQLASGSRTVEVELRKYVPVLPPPPEKADAAGGAAQGAKPDGPAAAQATAAQRRAAAQQARQKAAAAPARRPPANRGAQ